MSRMCKAMLIGFSCLVFVMFLAWSASDPGRESRNEILSVEEERNLMIMKDDVIDPQVAYRFKPADNDVHHKVMNNVMVNDNKQEKKPTQQDSPVNVMDAQPQEDVRPETFFSSLNLTFSDIKLLENNSIPTEIFIAACREMGPFLSKLGSGISVIKREVESNLHDINRKFIQDKDSYLTLQAMVISEMDSGVVMKQHTCSRSLRWLRRMFEFIYIFLEKLALGEKDLTKAARVAYDATISMHHNYFIRKAITTGLLLLPRYNTFLVSMSVNKMDAENSNFEQIFNEDVLNYISTLKPICNNIKQFYTDQNLEN